MIATGFLLLFLMFVPRRFKKIGIRLVMEGKRQGLLLFLLSKALWWFAALEIAKIWLVHQYHGAAYAFVAVLLVIQIYKDKKYILFSRVKNQAVT